MIVMINDANKVIATCSHGEPDNIRSFYVESMPERNFDAELCYNPETGFYHVKSERIEKAKRKEELHKEYESIMQWLRDNDWIPNKIVTKEWEETDMRWQTYLSERLKKRRRMDEITELLKGGDY